MLSRWRKVATSTATSAQTELDDAPKSLVAEIDLANKIKVSETIGEQIWREQQLISIRMMWNLTFQGFLIGAFAYVAKNFSGDPRLALQLILAFGGLGVFSAAYRSIGAARAKSRRLKRHWMSLFASDSAKCPSCGDGSEDGDCDIVTGYFVQPFSPLRISKRGRWASTGLCIVIAGMWVMLTAFAFYLHRVEWQEPVALVPAVSQHATEARPASDEALPGTGGMPDGHLESNTIAVNASSVR